jgi:succinate dehydrogenase / fumarate reductase, membrane anchor subunit
MRTARKTTVGLGSAKSGSDHFIQQRVSALALIILVPWFFVAMLTAYQAGYDQGIAFVRTPITTIPLILLLTAAFYHMRLGIQVIIEDYIHKHSTRAALLILNTFLAFALWLTAVFTVLTIAL